jgi:hypothetical protein
LLCGNDVANISNGMGGCQGFENKKLLTGGTDKYLVRSSLQLDWKIGNINSKDQLSKLKGKRLGVIDDCDYSHCK